MTRSPQVDAYIAAASAAARPILTEMRRIILDSVPSAVETMKYGMPSYAYRGRPFVHVSAAKAHIGVYGLVHEDGRVPEELAPYLDHRSTLRFRFTEPLPSRALEETVRRKAAEVDANQA